MLLERETHTLSLFRCYFMQGLISNSVYVCLNMSNHGLGLAATWTLHALKHTSAPLRAVFLSVTHSVRNDTSHSIFSLHYTVMNFFFFEALMIDLYFEIFVLLGFYVM